MFAGVFIDALEKLFDSAGPTVQMLVLLALIGIIVVITVVQLSLRGRIKNLKGELKVSSDRLEIGKTDLASLEAKHQKLLSSSASLRTQNQSAERELVDLKAKHANLDSGLSSIKTRVKSLDSDYWMTEFGPFGELRSVHRLDRRARYVVVQNLKGGVGKTATVSNLAAAYATGVTGEELKVLVVDLDFQGSLSNCCASINDLDTKRSGELTSSCLIEDVPKPVSQLVCTMPGTNGNAHVIVADESLLGVDFKQQARAVVLVEEVRLKHLSVFHSPDVYEKYDLVMFDCPPRMTTSTINALIASDWLLIPSTLEPNDIDAVPRALRWLTKLQRAKLVETQLAGVLINRVYYQNTGIGGQLKADERSQLSLLNRHLEDAGFRAEDTLESFVSKNSSIPSYAVEDRPFATTTAGREHYKRISLDLYDKIR